MHAGIARFFIAHYAPCQTKCCVEMSIKAGGDVRGINAKGLGDYSRKKIDALTKYVKENGEGKSC